MRIDGSVGQQCATGRLSASSRSASTASSRTAVWATDSQWTADSSALRPSANDESTADGSTEKADGSTENIAAKWSNVCTRWTGSSSRKLAGASTTWRRTCSWPFDARATTSGESRRQGESSNWFEWFADAGFQSWRWQSSRGGCWPVGRFSHWGTCVLTPKAASTIPRRRRILPDKTT